jgi:hypothetical protein
MTFPTLWTFILFVNIGHGHMEAVTVSERIPTWADCVIRAIHETTKTKVVAVRCEKSLGEGI